MSNISDEDSLKQSSEEEELEEKKELIEKRDETPAEETVTKSSELAAQVINKKEKPKRDKSYLLKRLEWWITIIDKIHF